MRNTWPKKYKILSINGLKTIKITNIKTKSRKLIMKIGERQFYNKEKKYQILMLGGKIL
jgi:hypothetical protein